MRRKDISVLGWEIQILAIREAVHSEVVNAAFDYDSEHLEAIKIQEP